MIRMILLIPVLLISACAVVPSAGLPVACEWIDSATVLPEDGKQVLMAVPAVVKDKNVIGVGPGIRKDGQWLIKNQYPVNNVTHWMYYPAAPQTEQVDVDK